MPGGNISPAYNPIQVLTGQARLFIKPYDALVPAELPDPDTVMLGGAWDASWKAVGATLEGVTLSFSRETQEIRIEEQPTPVDVTTSSAALTVTVTLSEDTLETMIYAYGGGVITATAAGAGVVGKRQLALSTAQMYFAIGMEAQAGSGFYRRVLIPQVSSVGEVETAYRRAEQQRVYAASFQSLVPLEDIEIVEMDAVATS